MYHETAPVIGPMGVKYKNFAFINARKRKIREILEAKSVHAHNLLYQKLSSGSGSLDLGVLISLMLTIFKDEETSLSSFPVPGISVIRKIITLSQKQ